MGRGRAISGRIAVVAAAAVLVAGGLGSAIALADDGAGGIGQTTTVAGPVRVTVTIRGATTATTTTPADVPVPPPVSPPPPIPSQPPPLQPPPPPAAETVGASSPPEATPAVVEPPPLADEPASSAPEQPRPDPDPATAGPSRSSQLGPDPYSLRLKADAYRPGLRPELRARSHVLGARKSKRFTFLTFPWPTGPAREHMVGSPATGLPGSEPAPRTRALDAGSEVPLSFGRFPLLALSLVLVAALLLVGALLPPRMLERAGVPRGRCARVRESFALAAIGILLPVALGSLAVGLS